MCYGSKPLCYTLHLFCTLAFFELTLYLIFTVSPVQVRSNAIVHLLFFSQIEFFKNAQKPHKKAVKTDCIYFDRFFWCAETADANTAEQPGRETAIKRLFGGVSADLTTAQNTAMTHTQLRKNGSIAVYLRQ